MQSWAITLDVDWAPDFVIEDVAERLTRAGLAATWFITHDSPAIRSHLLDNELFEVGIHPNFLPGSTHGSSYREVLDHCLRLVPDASSMRTHCLYQSTRMFEAVLEETDIWIDVSLLLHRVSGLFPSVFRWKGRDLVRVPFIWEDDFEWQLREPSWATSDWIADSPGMKVVNFHPIHIYLNTDSQARYEELKERLYPPSEPTIIDLEDCQRPGPGVGSLFADMLTMLNDRSGNDLEVVTIRDIGQRFMDALEVGHSRLLGPE